MTAGEAHAQLQMRAECSTAPPPGIGASVGKSSPYFDLSRTALDQTPGGSVIVRGGVRLAARADLPIAGAWRARVEGSTVNWQVTRTTYDDSFAVTARDTVGHVGARQIVAMLGRQGGRSPACGYVLAGGGIYSLDYRGARIRRPGVALNAGIELWLIEHGAVQLDVQVHLIDTRARSPVASTTALAASLTVGWLHRF
jgi:hypothetical protein